MAVILSEANGSLYFAYGVYGTSGEIQGFFTAFRMTIAGYTGMKTGINSRLERRARIALPLPLPEHVFKAAAKGRPGNAYWL